MPVCIRFIFSIVFQLIVVTHYYHIMSSALFYQWKLLFHRKFSEISGYQSLKIVVAQPETSPAVPLL